MKDKAIWKSVRCLVATVSMLASVATAQPVQANPSVTYQGEDIGEAQSTHPGYTGRGYVSMGDHAEEMLEVENVELPSGRYRTWIRYALQGTHEQTIELIVNGVSQGEIAFTSTGSWEDWSSAHLDFILPEGEKNLVLRKVGGRGTLNLDYVYLIQLEAVSYYHLMVTYGSGDGFYVAGEVVDIVAGDAPAGMIFDNWDIDQGSPEIYDRYSSSTQLIMPAHAVEVVVWHVYDPDCRYELTVVRGSGDGIYGEGWDAWIVADEAPPGQVFHRWEVLHGAPWIADVYDYRTDLEMRGGEDAVIRATYIDGDLFTRAFQAEDYSDTEGCRAIDSHDNHTGWGYVDMGNRNSWFEMSIDIDTAGYYLVDFHYSSARPAWRSCEISVDGDAQETIWFAPTHNWATWSWVELPLWFERGINVIRVTAEVASRGGPNIDRIEWTLEP